MTIAYDAILACAVLMIWLGALAYFRLSNPLQRIHVVTFGNVVGGGLVVLAAILSDGATSRSLKCVFIWLASSAFGALLAQVSGRALYLRARERR